MYLDDGRRAPELGVRVQNDTIEDGVFHYDLRKSTGWKGIVRFKLRIVVPSVVAGRDNTAWFDYIVISDRPFSGQPETP